MEFDPFTDAPNITTSIWRVERVGPIAFLTAQLDITGTGPVDALGAMPAAYRPRNSTEEILLSRIAQLRGAITLTSTGHIYLRGLVVGGGARATTASWVTSGL